MAHSQDDTELGNELVDSKLRLIASPIDEKTTARIESMGLDAETQPDIEHLGFRYSQDHDCPEFVKHSGSTNYELFFDLWFVANLEVFSSSKGVSEESDLRSYIGFLAILWFTWFVVGMFDVRYVTDSIFERLIRVVHLGTMCGFAVVVTNFDPEDQKKHPVQILSWILMVSRLTLVVQYSTILWHVRKFKSGKYPLMAAASIHFVAAMIYLGIGFRFEDGRNSRVYVVWYIVAAVEAVAQLALGLVQRVLTFSGTHLTERMTVLTVIILGAGVTSIAKNVVLIVDNNNLWTSATIGVVISAIAIMYIFFMIYFDWMNYHHLDGWRQLVWVILHFPFHVAMLLFMEGVTQFITWWKVTEVTGFAINEFVKVFDRIAAKNSANPDEITGEDFAHSLNDTIQEIWTLYTPEYTVTYERIETTLGQVEDLIDGFMSENNTYTIPEFESEWETYVEELMSTVTVSLFANFKIDVIGDMLDDGIDIDPTTLMANGVIDIDNRANVVFEYSFVTAGTVLFVMTLMLFLSRKRKWSVFDFVRTILFLLLGIGLCLVVLLQKNELHAGTYFHSPWMVPTICLVFVTVLILTHLPNPPPLFFAKSLRTVKSWKPGRKSNSVAYQPAQSQSYPLYQPEYVQQQQHFGNKGYAPQPTYDNGQGQYFPDTCYSHAYGQASPPARYN